MTVGARIWAFVRGLGSLTLLVLLLVGPPSMLVVFVGWPLPTAVPSTADIEHAVSVGIDDMVVVKGLAIVAWVYWLQIALVISAETLAVVRGRSSAFRSAIPGLQVAVGRLVAGVTLLATTFTHAPVAGAAPIAPEPVTQLVGAPSPDVAPPVEPTVTSAPSSAVSTAHVEPPASESHATLQVRRHDSWWAIAERTLGDGLRWRELRDLNVGRTMLDGHTIAGGSDLLRPGWVLLLPADAMGDGGETVGASAPGSPSSSPQRPPAGEADEVTTVAGDSMWRIAERRVAAALGRPATSPEIAAYWTNLVETNRDRFPDPANPDLIHVGQRFDLPAVPGAPDGGGAAPPTVGATTTTVPVTPEEPGEPATESETGDDATAPGAPEASSAPDDSATSGPEVSETVAHPPSTAGNGDRSAEPHVPQAPDSTDAVDAAPPVGSGETGQSGSTGSAPPSEEEEGRDDLVSPGHLAIGAASSLLAVGVVRALRRARRRRHHLAPGARPVVEADPALHRRLLVDADQDQIEVLSRALADLAEGVAHAGLGCRPLVVQHSTDHLDVLLDHPTVPAVDGWHAQANGEVWTAEPAEGGSEIRDSDVGVATPLLVTLGEPDDGGQLYLDLETARLVTLTGDPPSAHHVAVTMATELAHSPLAAEAQIAVVGQNMRACLGDFDRIQVRDDWQEVSADLSAWNDQSRDALAQHGWPSTFAARGHDADHDALIPLVVIADELPDEVDLLGLLTAGPASTAVVIVGDPLPGATVVECAPDQLTLPQLGLACRAQALTDDQVGEVADLLRSAEAAGGGEQLDLGLDPSPVDIRHEDNGHEPAAPHADQPYEVLVRCLGAITVEVDGGAAPLTGKQTALVTYIALHSNVSSDRIADAVWVTPALVSHRKRLANTITKCRAAIGAHHLPAAKDSRYTVGPDVTTDLELFERRVAAAEGAPPQHEAERLRGALDLVRGPVFDYASTERDSYSWVDVEHWISTWELKLAATAERAAALYLDLGEATEAVEIADQTLRAVPTHPGLTELLMRAHAANGDLFAVQRVYQAHVNALEQLDLDTVAGSTAELFERLRVG